MTASETSLVNIMPRLPPSRAEHSAWAAGVLGGDLFLAWIGFDPARQRDSRCILRYLPATSAWETVYEKSLAAPRAETLDAAPPAGHPPGATVRPALPSEAAGSLLVRLESPVLTENLRIAIDQGKPEVHGITPGAWSEAAAVLASAGQSILVASGDSFALQTLSDGAWKEHPMPDSWTGVPSRLARAGERLLLACDDATRGFDLWEFTGEKWYLRLARGAQRFSRNATVASCIPWNDAVYVASQAPAPRRGRPDGFELLRLYPDGSWDLVVGTPRFSPDGLKIPLAGMTAGMDDFQPARFCFLVANTRRLLLGTYEDVTGFRAWASPDGIAWTVISDEYLMGLARVREASAHEFSAGTAMVLAMDDMHGGQAFDIWLQPHAA